MPILWYFVVFTIIITGVLGVQIEHCNLVVNDTIVKKGVVNLVYTMERWCVTCYKEANNLVTLRTQLSNFGVNTNVFIAINELPASQFGARLPMQFELNVGQIWNTLGRKNGHIFVVDRCGKLAYQVIMPWAKQIYPFTTMSVLSALFDKPCGECNISTPVHDHTLYTNSFIGTHRATESSEEKDDHLENMRVKDSPIPLTIVYREKHFHQQGDRQVQYNLVEMRTKDPHYHGHGESAFSQEAAYAATNGNDSDVITAEIDTNKTTLRTPLKSTPPTDRNGDTRSKTGKESKLKTTDEEETRKLTKHYEPMMKWLNCAKYVMGKSTYCSHK